MSYLVYRSDGLPLQDFPSLKVYRDGRFVDAYSPQVNDVFSLFTQGQTMSYCVNRVDGDKAFTVLAAMIDFL